MPALNTSPAALDDVENSNQRNFADRQQAWGQQLVRMNAGDQTLADNMRMSFKNMSNAVDAVITQALLGSNPTLAEATLAFRAIQGEPSTTGTQTSPGVQSGVPAPGNTTPQQTKTTS